MELAYKAPTFGQESKFWTQILVKKNLGQKS